MLTDQRSWIINFIYPQKLCFWSSAAMLLFDAAVWGLEVHGLSFLFVPFSCQKGKTSVPLPVTVARAFHPTRCWEFVPQRHRGLRIIWGMSVAYGRSKLTFALARTIHNLTFVYRMTVWVKSGCCCILCDQSTISERWRSVGADTGTFYACRTPSEWIDIYVYVYCMADLSIVLILYYSTVWEDSR